MMSELPRTTTSERPMWQLALLYAAMAALGLLWIFLVALFLHKAGLSWPLALFGGLLGGGGRPMMNLNLGP